MPYLASHLARALGHRSHAARATFLPVCVAAFGEDDVVPKNAALIVARVFVSKSKPLPNFLKQLLEQTETAAAAPASSWYGLHPLHAAVAAHQLTPCSVMLPTRAAPAAPATDANATGLVYASATKADVEVQKGGDGNLDQEEHDALMRLATEKWDGAPATGPGFQRRRGYVRGGPLPPGYVCNRCRKPGHHIRDCPTNGDKAFDIKTNRMGPQSWAGVPKDQLETNEDGIVTRKADDKAFAQVGGGKCNQAARMQLALCLTAPVACTWQAMAATMSRSLASVRMALLPHEIPDHLKCPIDKKLLKVCPCSCCCSCSCACRAAVCTTLWPRR